jgi:hypothetical protein
MSTRDDALMLIRGVLQSPIAFHRIFVTITGSVTAALMLSQSYYWSQRTKSDGWFYKTQEEWHRETGLSRCEQETARRILRNRGLIEEVKKGVPCKLYFRVNESKLLELLIAVTKHVESSQSSERKALAPDCGISANKNANKQPSITENNSMITQKNNHRVISDMALPVATIKHPKESDLIFNAIARVCRKNLAIISKNMRRQLRQTSASFIRVFLDTYSLEGLADEINRFGAWWKHMDWRGQKGQTPSPNDLLNEWEKYESDCREHPERYWEYMFTATEEHSNSTLQLEGYES